MDKIEKVEELENEIVEGSETPDVDAEKKSVDSVKSAAQGGKTAKALKGSNSNQEKSELDNKAQDKGTDAGKDGGTSKNSLPSTSGYDNSKKYPSLKKESYVEELNDLVESEATLSEEFKEKTAVIFEAALKSKLSEEIDRLEESYATQLEEEISSYKASLSEKVDSYLSYVAEEWMKENKLAVQAGLRTEIAENFMSKLKDVFVESYITVPETKEDLVDGLVEQVESLEKDLNEVTKSNIAISEELKGLKRERIIAENARGLADTQVEKLESLVADVDFVSESEFTKKVKTIKESFFVSESVKEEEILDEDFSEEKEVSSIMETYLKALKK